MPCSKRHSKTNKSSEKLENDSRGEAENVTASVLQDEEDKDKTWTGGWFSWTRQSDAMLRCVEKTILSCLKTAYKRFYVDIGSVVGQSDKIWTISLNDDSNKTPLVLLHGMGAGLALWCPNLDAFAAHRPVYAIDLLGFGRSSRPKFSSDATKVEAQWVESVEEWRREVNLGEFVLLGHSLGGYIATAYALKYPERVRHLILADPWGFPERPSNVYEKYQVPLWIRAVVTVIQPLNPLWAVRVAGPAGKWLVSKTRPDIARKYTKYVPDANTVIPEYIYQCNSQTPSGESAFHSLMNGLAWAKNPMATRLDKLDPALPVTVLYGSRSWIDNVAGQTLAEQRPNCKTHVQVINGAGHHVYLDKPEVFNKFVNEACASVDEAGAREPMTSEPETKDVTDATEAPSTPASTVTPTSPATPPPPTPASNAQTPTS
ncbi:1-acylglycerol-3-phosphate O-acyltransferase ABHD5 isoform X2 [Pectinophora gossypiella]|uniref:1-acylglycerol-3-phosphate O-acyltransferase ABHD5 isoform X2 n=1 Tax=Pectinophora gossypiella TaxID=13191 RepID=UPI00214EC651|nr:1-acylglycerol-3-phosphate O-acyltransferase ABHD5 isoform X2 [Pectinophora gossypiella]